MIKLKEDTHRKIFIGSSREGIRYAKNLKIFLDKSLKPYNLQCVMWEDAFLLSETTIGNLENFAKQLNNDNGYAVLIITPDDKIKFRGEEYYAPRDNIIFELGLFRGILGKNRTFCVAPKNKKIKMMSDWSGVTNATYEFAQRVRNDTWENRLQDAVKRISQTIDSIERPKVNNSNLNIRMNKEQINERKSKNMNDNNNFSDDIFKSIEQNMENVIRK